MKKKLAAVICTLTMVLGMVTACGSDSKDAATDAQTTDNAETTEDAQTADDSADDSQDSTGDTAERTTLTVGFDAEFPPYGYLDENGEYVGFDLSLAQEVCNRLGWELVKQPIDWDSKDMELESGTIDCIWNGFTMNGREEEYTWTVPYVDNSQVFVAAADSGITGQADLAGRNIAVQADSSALAALKEEESADLLNSFASLQEYGDYNTAFMDLEAGAVDAVAMDIGVAEYQMAQRDMEFVILDEYLATEQYGIGFKLGNEELRDTVQAVLLEMAEDGTFMEIAEQWGLEGSVCLGK